MMKNVTLRLDARLLKKVQHMAVDEGLSLSAWLAKHLEDLSVRNDKYAIARKSALKRLEKGWHLGGKPLTRDEVHER